MKSVKTMVTTRLQWLQQQQMLQRQLPLFLPESPLPGTRWMTEVVTPRRPRGGSPPRALCDATLPTRLRGGNPVRLRLHGATILRRPRGGSPPAVLVSLLVLPLPRAC